MPTFGPPQGFQDQQFMSGSVFNPMRPQTDSGLLNALMGFLLPQSPMDALQSALFPAQIGTGGKLSNLGDYGRFKYSQLLQDIGDQQANILGHQRGHPFSQKYMDATAQLELLADQINKFPETQYSPVPSIDMLVDAIKNFGLSYTGRMPK